MINTNNAIENLKELDYIFRKHNIRYWLQDGTLLGYYRDNNFIPHDNDIDIGIRWSDFTREAFLEISNNGFEFNSAHGRLKTSLVINFRKRKIPIDIYFYYYEGDRFYHTAAYGWKKLLRVDFSYKDFDVKEIDFFGQKFFIPEDPLYFIETKYGKDWQTPKSEWNSSEEPLNCTFTNIATTKKESKKAFRMWTEGKE